MKTYETAEKIIVFRITDFMGYLRNEEKPVKATFKAAFSLETGETGRSRIKIAGKGFLYKTIFYAE